MYDRITQFPFMSQYFFGGYFHIQIQELMEKFILSIFLRATTENRIIYNKDYKHRIILAKKNYRKYIKSQHFAGIYHTQFFLPYAD